ncbi:hypothetical protein [Pasteurella multocida]|uniref:hypothetical protein n=1 Tax=Pasteurella multocida TaxID=747 RepID=UPI00094AA068|nr:hypothetical protein [Pasteurella multocida]HEH9721763.1 hypothetical protein [Pasteurella multocida]HEH9820564.1 hypothetical protein [Pasteurella multocida]
MAKWLLKYDSHELKKGDVFEGDTLPLWLVGKVVEIEDAFEVATPNENSNTLGETSETSNKGKETPRKEGKQHGGAKN